MPNTSGPRLLPPRGAVWLIVALAALALGLLRTTVTLMLDDDPRASAALTAFLLSGPAAVLLYFFLQFVGRPVHRGTVVSDPVRAGALTALAVVSYAAPGEVMEGPTFFGIVFIVGAAATSGVVVALALRRYFARSTPDSADGAL